MEYITVYNLKTFLESLKELEPLFRGGVSILIIFIGWLASVVTRKIIITFLNKIKFNKVIKRLGWEEKLKRAEIKLDGTHLFGKIGEWLVFIVFLMVAFDVAGINYFSILIGKVVNYFPNIIVASLIFIVTVFASDFSYRIVVASKEGNLFYSKIIGSIIRSVIWVFTTLAILLQLGIAPEIIKALTYGIIAMVAIAGGLAFGLGGKEIAAEILKDIKNRFS